MSTNAMKPRPVAAASTLSSAPGEERGVMRDVSWNFYSRLTDAMVEGSPIRVAYDGKDLEIMTLGPKHERFKEVLGLFIYEVSVGLEVDFRPAGSTTWKRVAEQCGVESDLCYYFHRAKLEASDAAADYESNDVADYPNPDLVAEIDISPSKIDRPKIYAALRVSEIWRFKDDAISIERLGPDKVYVAVTESGFLCVRPDEITRWLADGKSGSMLDWRRRLQDWIQADLRPRVVAKPSRRRSSRPTRRRSVGNGT